MGPVPLLTACGPNTSTHHWTPALGTLLTSKLEKLSICMNSIITQTDFSLWDDYRNKLFFFPSQTNQRYREGEGYLDGLKGTQTYSGCLPTIRSTASLLPWQREASHQNSYGKFVPAIPNLINRNPAGNLFCKENRKSADVASSGPISWVSARKEVIETIPNLWPEALCNFLISCLTKVLSSEY